MKSEVSALSPRVAFLDHQRLVLNVDNSTLKQRIAALAQDKIFKDGKYLSCINWTKLTNPFLLLFYLVYMVVVQLIAFYVTHGEHNSIALVLFTCHLNRVKKSLKVL